LEAVLGERRLGRRKHESWHSGRYLDMDMK
jgi:hypothetical protein